MNEVHKTGSSQYLTFQLAGERYGFDVLKTREVLSVVKIAPLPNAASFLSGVINLRGNVVPVVDLRKKFGMPAIAQTIDSAIIIVEISVEGEFAIIGTLVDEVRGVMNCEVEDLEAPPRFGIRLNSNLVQAIAKVGSEFVVILDTEKVFSEKELWLTQEPESAPLPGVEA